MHLKSSRPWLISASFLIGFGLLAVSALAFFGSALPTRAAETSDPAVVIGDYVAAVNAGDLDAILALYSDDAFHIALPSADGSHGVCVGKEQFRMWYEQSLANGDRVAVEDDSIAVDGNQATFVAKISSEPWTKLGLKSLDATSEIVVIDGQIMTHVVVLTPESVRQLQAAEAKAA
jgi:ketosteroid isomerase-like protein